MPGLSGLDLARRLRETRPEIAVVLLTGFASRRRRRPISPDVPILAKPLGEGRVDRGAGDRQQGARRRRKGTRPMKKRIYLVEDELEICALVRDLLETYGCLPRSRPKPRRARRHPPRGA